jgi:hydroxypyruvate reductase
MKNVSLLSGGTDGEDGPTDAAGAVADEQTWAAALQQGLKAVSHLAAHSAYDFFSAAGGLIKTGPTDTNVMDVRVFLVAE